MKTASSPGSFERALLPGIAPLLAWFRANRRELPWRQARTPYTVLVSELMLQQTRVEAVKIRYLRFLEAFPTPEQLAAASEEEVLKAWEGLGYYSRARNLKRAAEIIAREGFPATFEGVRALPGVGDYTAGAICSIALGLKTPAVDGNVLRILTRYFADGRDIAEAGTKKYFCGLLASVYPEEAGEFTEALMELGAIVCVPNGPPMCGACPWVTLCRAHAEGCEEAFPVRAEKRPRRMEYYDVFVLKCGGKYALVRRPDGGLLAGLYGLPMAARKRGDAPPAGLKAAVEAKHIFTHVEWHMRGFLVEVASEDVLPGAVWETAAEIDARYPVPSAFRAFRTLIS